MILIPWENMFPWQIFHVLFHKHLQTWLQLGFGVRGLPSSSGSQFMGGSRQPRNLHDRKCSASFPISESDTLPLRRCPSVSLIKDNCPQTLIFTGPRTQMWHALSIFRTWPLSLLPATQPRGCLLPIPTCRSSLPDWTPLITCQLDWLQVFIICDDWADLEANLNQGCWRTEESIAAAAAADLDPSSPQEVYSSLCSVLTSCYPQASLQTLANIRFVCMRASKVLLQNEWGALSLPLPPQWLTTKMNPALLEGISASAVSSVLALSDSSLTGDCVGLRLMLSRIMRKNVWEKYTSQWWQLSGSKVQQRNVWMGYCCWLKRFFSPSLDISQILCCSYQSFMI